MSSNLLLHKALERVLDLASDVDHKNADDIAALRFINRLQQRLQTGSYHFNGSIMDENDVIEQDTTCYQTGASDTDSVLDQLDEMVNMIESGDLDGAIQAGLYEEFEGNLVGELNISITFPVNIPTP